MEQQNEFVTEFGSLQNLELLARQVVEGFLIGLHKSPFHGFSVEFAEHRLYNPGESTRHIDWKVLARTDRVYVKKFEEETNLRCQLVLDASSSMYFPEVKESQSGLRKIDFSCVAAASVMHLLKKQRDAFGLTIFSDKVEQHSNVKSSSIHNKLLLGQLQHVMNREPGKKKTAAAACLHEVAEKLHRRSMVVIFSDMFENMLTDSNEYQAIFSALQHLKHNKHEVILFHVLDKSKEMAFDFVNRPYRFVDLETGEQLKLTPNQVKESYVQQMQDFYQQLKLRCGQFKIDLVEADVNQGFRPVLLPYLMKREKFN
ncbi:MAG: DUF58 domain-containing protein [Chitinophagales bacterium]|nr:DUF58 domain-containing protein [Chitinophagaceae bacterium]MBP9881796.1 DUF58 domain-containing protein [Chitinophagales bacterium]